MSVEQMLGRCICRHCQSGELRRLVPEVFLLRLLRWVFLMDPVVAPSCPLAEDFRLVELQISAEFL